MSASLPEDDRTADWPSDPDNEQLAQFARRFQAELPEMLAPSLEKVGQAMRDEMARTSAPGKRWGVIVRVAVAAAVLFGLGVAGYFVLHREKDRPQVHREKSEAPQPEGLKPAEAVEDRFQVNFVAPAEPPLPDKALVRLDDNRSLFMD